MIVIFYAFSREVSALKRRFETRGALEVKGLKGFHGKLGANEVAAIATGIGINRARETARRAFESLSPVDFAISTGVAGALSEGLTAGDVIVADRFALQSESGANQVVAMSAPELDRVKNALRAVAIHFSVGAILTSPHPLVTAAAKRRAKAETGAIAVEMESAAIALEAARCSIPFACVRTILDTADDEVIGAEVADEQGRVRPLRAASFIVRHPAAIVTLGRLARNLGIATKSLAGAIEAIVRHTA